MSLGTVSRALRGWGGALLAAGLLVAVACEEQGPEPRSTTRLAFTPVFQGGSAGVIPVGALRVVVLRADSATVAMDTTISLAVDQDSVDIVLVVPSDMSGEQFIVGLTVTNPTGQPVFTGGPIRVTGGSTVPVTVQMRYIGIGFNAAGVRITTPIVFLAPGTSVTLTAEAVDSGGEPIPGTPILWRSTDTTKAGFLNKESGTLVATQALGTFSVIAQLLTGQADTAAATVAGSVSLSEAVDSLANTLFLAITTAIEDPSGNRIEAINWPATNQFSFEPARARFEAAHLQNPLNQTAAFGLAVSTILALEDHPQFRQIAEAIDVWGSNSNNQFEDLFQGPGPYPPTPGQIQALARDVIQPALITALEKLNIIDSASFVFVITPRMQGTVSDPDRPARQLDLTDVLFSRAALEAAIAFINGVVAYNWTPDPYGPAGLDAALAPGSGFLQLAANGAALLADAHARLQRAVSLSQQAFTSLVSETDNQTDDIVRFAPGGGFGRFNSINNLLDFRGDSLAPADVADANDALTDAAATLMGPHTFTEDFGQGIVDLVIDVTRAFFSPVNDLKGLLPPYQTTNGEFNWTALAFDEWLFPDPTFNNVLPGIPSNDSLKKVVDFEGLYDDARLNIDRWTALTRSPVDGDLLALTQNGRHEEIAFDFSVVSARPNINLGPNIVPDFRWITANATTGQLVASGFVFDTVIFNSFTPILTRPDDAVSPWTVATTVFTCCNLFLVEDPAGTGSMFAVTDGGDLLQFPSDFSQLTDLADVPFSVAAMVGNTQTNTLAVLSFDGMLFSRPADLISVWTQEALMLPFIDFDDRWVAMTQSPVDGAYFAITVNGDLVEIASDLSTSTDRPDVPATSVFALTANTITGELVAMTDDGRIFTRPDDAVSPWTLRTTLTRTILP